MRCLLAVLLLPCLAFAQPERYELGKRLKAFELAWEKQPDAAVRKQALKIIEKVTPQFFSGSFGEAGRTLDEARWVLEKKTPTDAERWLSSLYASPNRHLLTTNQRKIKVIIKPFYQPKVPAPKKAMVQIGLPGADRISQEIDSLPLEITVPAPKDIENFGMNEGFDNYLQILYYCEPGVFLQREVLISFIDPMELTKRDSDLFRRLPGIEDRSSPMVKATMAELSEKLNAMNEDEIPEIDLPMAKITSQLKQLGMMGMMPSRLKDREMALEMLSDLHLKGSQYYFSIPYGTKKTCSIRLFRPVRSIHAMDRQRKPVVIALHGMGGSENLFFEAYGAGHIVKECQERGWILIAPRCNLSISGQGPPIREILNSLEEILPIDRSNVFIVGHSMGAAQAVSLAQEHPDWYRGVAALGGGGRVTKPEAFDKLPLFVGVGDKDFALAGAKKLAKDLQGKKVTYKEYPDFEHLVIVREALPDVFKEWDKLVKPKGPVKEN